MSQVTQELILKHPDWIEWSTKVLSLAVIPCLMWAKSLDEDRALLIERQSNQATEITELKNQLNSTNSKVNNLEGSLREIKVKIDLMTTLLQDLKSDIAIRVKDSSTR